MTEEKTPGKTAGKKRAFRLSCLVIVILALVVAFPFLFAAVYFFMFVLALSGHK